MMPDEPSDGSCRDSQTTPSFSMERDRSSSEAPGSAIGFHKCLSDTLSAPVGIYKSLSDPFYEGAREEMSGRHVLDKVPSSEESIHDGPPPPVSRLMSAHEELECLGRLYKTVSCVGEDGQNMESPPPSIKEVSKSSRAKTASPTPSDKAFESDRLDAAYQNDLKTSNWRVMAAACLPCIFG